MEGIMIAIGSDHGGYILKEELKKYFDEKEIEYKDVGTYSRERTDFPIYAEKVAKSIQSGECDKGILICTSGVGMTIAANKFNGIRCAVCSEEWEAKQAKEHCNVNVLALSAEKSNISNAVQLYRIWIASEFLNGRYAERLQMIEKIEENEKNNE